MVLFNYSTKEITAKIVYYGPGLCGKTTNLQYIHSKLDVKNRGKLLSLATETDRTLFFDFLPLDLGKISGFHVRFQLYTVPGQVHYNATRRMVLKGVDAVVFVADSQAAMLEHNKESFENLRENLAENGYKPENVPLVIQLNKRDLPNIASPETILEALNASDLEHYEAVATQGDGVFETLKTIIKRSVAKLKTDFNEESLEAPSMEGLGPGPAVKVSREPQPLFNPDTPMVEGPPPVEVEDSEAAGVAEIDFESAAPAEETPEEIEMPLPVKDDAGEGGGEEEGVIEFEDGSDFAGVLDLSGDDTAKDEAAQAVEEIVEVPLDDEISLEGSMDLLDDDLDADMGGGEDFPHAGMKAPDYEGADMGEPPVYDRSTSLAPGVVRQVEERLERLSAEVEALKEENRKIRAVMEKILKGFGGLTGVFGDMAGLSSGGEED